MSRIGVRLRVKDYIELKMMLDDMAKERQQFMKPLVIPKTSITPKVVERPRYDAKTLKAVQDRLDRMYKGRRGQRYES